MYILKGNFPCPSVVVETFRKVHVCSCFALYLFLKKANHSLQNPRVSIMLLYLVCPLVETMQCTVE